MKTVHLVSAAVLFGKSTLTDFHVSLLLPQEANWCLCNCSIIQETSTLTSVTAADVRGCRSAAHSSGSFTSCYFLLSSVVTVAMDAPFYMILLWRQMFIILSRWTRLCRPCTRTGPHDRVVMTGVSAAAAGSGCVAAPRITRCYLE